MINSPKLPTALSLEKVSSFSSNFIIMNSNSHTMKPRLHKLRKYYYISCEFLFLVHKMVKAKSIMQLMDGNTQIMKKYNSE